MKVTTTRSKLAKIGVLGIVFMFFAGSVIWYFYGGGRDLFFIEDYVPFVEVDPVLKETKDVKDKLSSVSDNQFPSSMDYIDWIDGFAFATVYIVVDEIILENDGFQYAVVKYIKIDGSLGKTKVYLSSFMTPNDFGFNQEWMLNDVNNTLEVGNYGTDTVIQNNEEDATYIEYHRVNYDELFKEGDVIGVRFMGKYRSLTSDEVVSICEEGSWLCPYVMYTNYFMPNVDTFSQTGEVSNDEYIFPATIQVIEDEDYQSLEVSK